MGVNTISKLISKESTNISTTIAGVTTYFVSKRMFAIHEVIQCKSLDMPHWMYCDFMSQWAYRVEDTVFNESDYEKIYADYLSGKFN